MPAVCKPLLSWHSPRADPGNAHTLAQWAERVFVSERILARQFMRETGISFGEWRQRLRFLAAIEQLETQQSIKEIAFLFRLQQS